MSKAETNTLSSVESRTTQRLPVEAFREVERIDVLFQSKLRNALHRQERSSFSKLLLESFSEIFQGHQPLDQKWQLFLEAAYSVEVQNKKTRKLALATVLMIWPWEKEKSVLREEDLEQINMQEQLDLNKKIIALADMKTGGPCTPEPLPASVSNLEIAKGSKVRFTNWMLQWTFEKKGPAVSTSWNYLNNISELALEGTLIKSFSSQELVGEMNSIVASTSWILAAKKLSDDFGKDFYSQDLGEYEDLVDDALNFSEEETRKLVEFVDQEFVEASFAQRAGILTDKSPEAVMLEKVNLCLIDIFSS
jgi:hypothetical protein